eukprot:CAMPEP_0174264196 /NCGR_PEP_ID=MMETSP0439-20130205/21652_1 /TAXON_ID=0 /ORGANISM="Stereomyxa ramosa, Strain Chinc5" /LENGTH=181 /DNA_ID=CAMNT_0015349955 /DNA_START=136 /DNA_END=677 /DNA_ORIENTATION=+
MSEAADLGWKVSSSCVNGEGYIASGGPLANNTLSLRYNGEGMISGYRAVVGVEMPQPWFRNPDGLFQIDIFFRDPVTICDASSELSMQKRDEYSVGDRLVAVFGEETFSFPITQKGAIEYNWRDSKVCMTDMGRHYLGPVNDNGGIMTMYSTSGVLTGLLLTSFKPQPIPPFEYFPSFSPP